MSDDQHIGVDCSVTEGRGDRVGSHPHWPHPLLVAPAQFLLDGVPGRPDAGTFLPTLTRRPAKSARARICESAQATTMASSGYRDSTDRRPINGLPTHAPSPLGGVLP